MKDHFLLFFLFKLLPYLIVLYDYFQFLFIVPVVFCKNVVKILYSSVGWSGENNFINPSRALPAGNVHMQGWVGRFLLRRTRNSMVTLFNIFGYNKVYSVKYGSKPTHFIQYLVKSSHSSNNKISRNIFQYQNDLLHKS